MALRGILFGVYQRRLLLCGLYNLPNQCCNGCTYEGTYDEDPEVCKSRTSLEHSWSDGAGRINRSTCVADAYEVNQHEAQTDSQTSKVVGGTVGLGCGTQYNEHEDAGEYNLCEQTAHQRYARLQIVGTRTYDALA